MLPWLLMSMLTYILFVSLAYSESQHTHALFISYPLFHRRNRDSFYCQCEINFLVFCANMLRFLDWIPRLNSLKLIGYTAHRGIPLAMTQITKFMGPTWGPPGSCRPQMGPMLAPWTLLSGEVYYVFGCYLPLLFLISLYPLDQFHKCQNEPIPFLTRLHSEQKFLFWMEYCRTWNRCILGFEIKINWLDFDPLFWSWCLTGRGNWCRRSTQFNIEQCHYLIKASHGEECSVSMSTYLHFVCCGNTDVW